MKIEYPSKETLSNYYNDILFAGLSPSIFYEMFDCGYFCNNIQQHKINQRRLFRI